MNSRAVFASIAGAMAIAIGVWSAPAQAQLFDRPRGEIPRGENPRGDIPRGDNGLVAQGSAAQAVRIDRLENQIRTLTGQIEQLQFQTRKLEEQLRKFQGDVDFRFQERNGGAARPGRRSEAPQAPEDPEGEPGPEVGNEAGEPPRTGGPSRLGAAPPPVEGAPATPGQPRRRGDAFDPQVQPDAPGAPRQLGAAQPSRPLEPPAGSGRRLPQGPIGNDPPDGGDAAEDPNAPIDLRQPRIIPGVTATARPPVEPAEPVAAAPRTAREFYDLAVLALREKRYDDAEAGFETFLKKFPRSGLAADATFNLGLSFERRNRHREAAEHYLKVATNYGKARRAAESMLRLGLSLERLGAQEQACATYNEASRKYPLAPGGVRVSLERQIKRAKC